MGGLVVLVLFFGGCGDGNLFKSLAENESPESLKEAASIALNKGDYSLAISTLQGLCGTTASASTCDSATSADLASAYMGRAGINATLINKVAESASSTTISSFTSFSSILPAPTAANQADLHAAVSLLSNIPNPTPDQSLQLAVTAASDLVVTLGVLTSGFNSAGVPTTLPTVAALVPVLDTVVNDLAQISAGVSGSGLVSSSQVNTINQISASLNSQSGTTTDAITASDLLSYLNSIR